MYQEIPILCARDTKRPHSLRSSEFNGGYRQIKLFPYKEKYSTVIKSKDLCHQLKVEINHMYFKTLAQIEISCKYKIHTAFWRPRIKNIKYLIFNTVLIMLEMLFGIYCIKQNVLTQLISPVTFSMYSLENLWITSHL